MDKKQIKKNLLDLEYHRHAHLANGVLLFGTTGLLSFTATYIWKPELLLLGTLVSAVIIMACVIVYKRITLVLEKISEEMDKLAG